MILLTLNRSEQFCAVLCRSIVSDWLFATPWTVANQVPLFWLLAIPINEKHHVYLDIFLYFTISTNLKTHPPAVYKVCKLWVERRVHFILSLLNIPYCSQPIACLFFYFLLPKLRSSSSMLSHIALISLLKINIWLDWKEPSNWKEP